jgi:hypothetical protein
LEHPRFVLQTRIANHRHPPVSCPFVIVYSSFSISDRVYWKLKRVEHSILQQVEAVSETSLFAPSLLRSSELELAIYRTTINILDYGALLSRTAPQREQWHKLQQVAESGIPYSNLVAQLTKVQM